MMGSTSRLISGVLLLLLLTEVYSQGSGGINVGKDTQGEREGDLSPLKIAGLTIAVVGVVGAALVTMFFCYYVYRKNQDNMSLPGYA